MPDCTALSIIDSNPLVPPEVDLGILPARLSKQLWITPTEFFADNPCHDDSRMGDTGQPNSDPTTFGTSSSAGPLAVLVFLSGHGLAIGTHEEHSRSRCYRGFHDPTRLV